MRRRKDIILYSAKYFLAAIVALTIIYWGIVAEAQTTACSFAPTSRITSQEQAKCLLRPVKRFGNLGNSLSSLPPPLNNLLNQPTITLDKDSVRRYLAANNITEAELGGLLSEPVSRANNNDPNAELARYFIIHDTSTPNFGNRNFPADINDESWSGNNLQIWVTPPPAKRKAHVFINRTGKSVTAVNFKTPWRATQYELQTVSRKGLFLNVELVQPRRRDPSGGASNDAISPVPGFTDAQLDRLALVYVAASVRRGKWLIPAFHAAVDAGIRNAHDDPQNFDLNRWASRLDILLRAISS